MACLGLHHIEGGHGGLVSLIKETTLKDASSPHESNALTSALMRVLSEGIEHATGLFSRLQANCLLARRDAVLVSCTFSEGSRSTLRTLLSNSSEFCWPGEQTREKIKQQDVLERIAMAPPMSSGSKRKRFGGQADGQAKQLKPPPVSQLSQSAHSGCFSPFPFLFKRKEGPHAVKGTLFLGNHPPPPPPPPPHTHTMTSPRFPISAPCGDWVAESPGSWRRGRSGRPTLGFWV